MNKQQIIAIVILLGSLLCSLLEPKDFTKCKDAIVIDRYRVENNGYVLRLWSEEETIEAHITEDEYEDNQIAEHLSICLKTGKVSAIVYDDFVLSH